MGTPVRSTAARAAPARASRPHRTSTPPPDADSLRARSGPRPARGAPYPVRDLRMAAHQRRVGPAPHQTDARPQVRRDLQPLPRTAVQRQHPLLPHRLALSRRLLRRRDHVRVEIVQQPVGRRPRLARGVARNGVQPDAEPDRTPLLLGQSPDPVDLLLHLGRRFAPGRCADRWRPSGRRAPASRASGAVPGRRRRGVGAPARSRLSPGRARRHPQQGRTAAATAPQQRGELTALRVRSSSSMTARPSKARVTPSTRTAASDSPAGEGAGAVTGR